MGEETAAGQEHGASEPERLLGLLHRMEALKHLPRAGWVDREIEEPESVAAHCWRLAMMAWLLAEAQGLDAWRAVRLALVHDLPEAITGDRTPFDDQASTAEGRRALSAQPPDPAVWRNPDRRAQKIAIERLALVAMLEDAPTAAARALRDTWEEYEAASSPEARLVQQLDKLEAYLQGWEYARSGRLAGPETLNSFRADTDRLVRDPALRALLAALEEWSRAPREPGRPAQAGREAGA